MKEAMKTYNFYAIMGVFLLFGLCFYATYQNLNVYMRDLGFDTTLIGTIFGLVFLINAITMIPGDSIPSEGNYSELRDLFNTSETNDYTCSIVPSQAIIDLSAAQKYCHYTTGGEYVYAPDGLDNFRSGDLRLGSVYTNLDNLGGLGMSVNGKRVTNYSVISKYQTRNVHILRRAKAGWYGACPYTGGARAPSPALVAMAGEDARAPREACTDLWA